MKSLYLCILCSGLMASALAAEQGPPIEDETAKINYSVGYQIGSDFRYQEMEVRPEALLRGIRDAMSDSQSQMSQAEMRQTMADLGRYVAEIKRKKREQLLQQHLEANQKYLQENAKREGVQVTESGLQYSILHEGEGQSPKSTDKVVVNYRGKLINGQEFDSSYRHGEAANFAVDQVIKGWSEALMMMRPGARWELVIPAELAYGEKGMGRSILPHSTLIFEVELLSVHQ